LKKIKQTNASGEAACGKRARPVSYIPYQSDSVFDDFCDAVFPLCRSPLIIRLPNTISKSRMKGYGIEKPDSRQASE
jgi:hypothetical protein